MCLNFICAKRLVTKRKFCYNEPEGRVLRARRARYTSPLGRVVECGGWISRGLWVMFSTGVAKSLFVVPWNPFRSATDQSFHSIDLKFGQNVYCKIISRYFFEFSKFKILIPFLAKKAFLRPKIMIQIFFSHMTCDL